MAKIDLHGVFPPITTPFIDGKVAYETEDLRVTLFTDPEG